MKGFVPAGMPVLAALAKEFAVCDGWFCSMPGPTWPNRFFALGASSAELDHSPSSAETAIWETLDGFGFENGSIFDAQRNSPPGKGKLPWRIYAGNKIFTLAHVLKGIQIWDIARYSQFAKDLSDPSYPASSPGSSRTMGMSRAIMSVATPSTLSTVSLGVKLSLRPPTTRSVTRPSGSRACSSLPGTSTGVFTITWPRRGQLPRETKRSSKVPTASVSRSINMARASLRLSFRPSFRATLLIIASTTTVPCLRPSKVSSGSML